MSLGPFRYPDFPEFTFHALRGPCFDSSNTWYNFSATLYLEWEVKADEEEDIQLATSLGVVTRPGFLARAGDRHS